MVKPRMAQVEDIKIIDAGKALGNKLFFEAFFILNRVEEVQLPDRDMEIDRIHFEWRDGKVNVHLSDRFERLNHLPVPGYLMQNMVDVLYNHVKNLAEDERLAALSGMQALDRRVDVQRTPQLEEIEIQSVTLIKETKVEEGETAIRKILTFYLSKSVRFNLFGKSIMIDRILLEPGGPVCFAGGEVSCTEIAIPSSLLVKVREALQDKDYSETLKGIEVDSLIERIDSRISEIDMAAVR